MTACITKQELEREGFFSNLAKEVKCQCGECGEDKFFSCELCNREVPYCFGAADEFEDLCDDCAVRQMDYQQSLETTTQRLSDEQIADLGTERDPKMIPCGCSENISKYDCKRFGCLRETL